MHPDEQRDVDGRDVVGHQERGLRAASDPYLGRIGPHRHFQICALPRR